jgi:hypothetical protein
MGARSVLHVSDLREFWMSIAVQFINIAPGVSGIWGFKSKWRSTTLRATQDATGVIPHLYAQKTNCTDTIAKIMPGANSARNFSNPRIQGTNIISRVILGVKPVKLGIKARICIKRTFKTPTVSARFALQCASP